MTEGLEGTAEELCKGMKKVEKKLKPVFSC